MTKVQAQDIKMKVRGAYKTYYSSKAETLSVRAYSYINSAYNAQEEREAIEDLMSRIGEDLPHEIKRRTYQGFIHDTDIIFS